MCHELKSSKLQRDIIDAVIITKIIVFDIICYADYQPAAKFKLPNLQLSNMTIQMRHQAILETKSETKS